MRKVISLVLFTIVFLSSPEAHATGGEAHPEWYEKLAPYLQRVPALNPSVASFRREAESLQAFAGAEAVLPDPMVGIGLQAVPTDGSFTREPMTQAPVVSLRQVIPYPGKLFAKREMIEARSEVFDVRAEATAEAMALELAGAAFQIERLRKELAYINETLEWLDLLLSSSESHYRTGRGSQSDVDQIRVEVGRLRADRSFIGGQLEDARARWRRALTEAPPKDFGLETEQPWAPAWPVTQAVLEGNPGIRMAKQMAAVADEQVNVEKSGYGPDFNVELGYGMRYEDRRDLLTGKIGVSVPLYAPWKQRRSVQGARDHLSSARLNLIDVQLEADTMLERARSTLKDAAARQVLYQNRILPDAATARASAQNEYNAGGADIFTPIQAIRNQLMARREFVRVVAQRREAEARILGLAGMLTGSRAPAAEPQQTSKDSTDEDQP